MGPIRPASAVTSGSLVECQPVLSTEQRRAVSLAECSALVLVGGRLSRHGPSSRRRASACTSRDSDRHCHRRNCRDFWQ